MPIPQIQLQWLERALREHEAALDRLSEQRRRLETETAIHQTMLKLGRDSNLLNLLHEIYDNADLMDELRNDLGSALRLRKITLPEGVTLRVLDAPRSGLRADLSVNGSKFYAQWTPELGFFSTAVNEGE